jgi:peptidoglycan lytic transglycosylase D
MPNRASTLTVTAVLLLLAGPAPRAIAADLPAAAAPTVPATVAATGPTSTAAPGQATVAATGPAAKPAAPPDLKAAAAADSAHHASVSPVEAARSAYEKAWDQRKTDPAAAEQTIEGALLDVDAALKASQDAGLTRELTDIRSKLSGLQDANRRSLQNEGEPVEPGNEADSTVLNQPAIDAIQPQFNGQVYRYIDFFTGAGRSTFERWLKRSGRYMDLFRSVLQREGLPPDLVHLVFVESGFNLNARSVSAAVGPWQFLKSTARLLGLTVNQWTDERRDPEKATVAAARYLKHLYAVFGDWPLALASYNAGEGTILRAIKAQGTTNYWDLKLPRQTEDYVPQFMAALAISRDPGKYGFDDVALDDPMAFDEIALKGAVDLHAVARLADCPYEDLTALNPAVLRGAATGRDGITTLRVPQGKGKVLLQKMADGTPLPAVNLTLKHRVHHGETLQSIASLYGVEASQIARDNRIGRRRPLRRGMVLTVHGSLKSHAPEPAQLADNDPRAHTNYVPPRTLGARNQLKASSHADGRVVVTVHKGQTLGSIAEQYGVSVADLKKWNHLKGARVARGTRLKIRTGDATGDNPEDQQQIAQLHVPKAHGHRHHGGHHRRHHRGAARGALAGGARLRRPSA